MKNICFGILLFVLPLRAADVSTETAEIKKQLENLFSESRKVNSATAKEKATSRAKIEAALDWDRIARDCLGAKETKKQGAASFKQFNNLLHDVIVKTAYTRLDKFWDGGTTYTFTKVDPKGKDAHVVVEFKVGEDPFNLDYYLTKKGPNWVVYDISYEGLRYSENINEQIVAFLKEKGFISLLDKLKKRRDELESKS